MSGEKIPSGYLQLDSPIKFKVDTIKDYDQDNTGDYIKTVEIKNNKPFGTLIVDKSVALKRKCRYINSRCISLKWNTI